MDWSDTALDFTERLGERFVFHCPPDGEPRISWGTDTYTADSSVCTTAVHAGHITFAGGGDVTIEMRSGEQSYVGSTRNGVTTNGYGSYGSSFVFVAAGAATPAPSQTPAADGTFGATTLLFEDDFSTADRGWQLGTDSWGSVAIEDGALAISMTQQSFVTSRVGPLDDSTWDVFRVEATLNGVGDDDTVEYVGLMCGQAGGEMVSGVLGSNGWRVFIRLGDPNVQVLDLQSERPVLWLTGPNRLAVECAGTNTGPLRMSIWLNDALAASYVGDDGPTSFDTVGVYHEGGPGAAVDFDDVVVHGGTGDNLPVLQPTPAPSGATRSLNFEELLDYVPPLIAGSCTDVTGAHAGAVVAASCTPDPALLPPGSSAQVTYIAFNHFSEADQYFGNKLALMGDQYGEDCSVGPSHYMREVDGDFVGRVLCAGDPALGDVLEAVWGDARLDVVGWMTMTGGSYADLGALLEAAQAVP